MRVLINGAKGFTNTSRVAKMVLFLFLVNLAFGLLLAVPVYRSLQDSFGDSLVGEQMASGFDYLWWEEFKDQARGVDQTFSPGITGKGALLSNLESLIRFRFLAWPPALLVLVFLYLLAHTFFAGGILTVYAEKTPRFTLKDFFKGAGAYFPRFLGLMITSWVFFVIILVIVGLLYRILNTVAENAFSEVAPFTLGLGFSALTLFLLFLVQMVFDYARISAVVYDKRVIRAALSGATFVFKHPVSTLGLYYLILLGHILVSVVYALLAGLLPQSTLPGVFLAFFFQQAFIFSLVWVRCWLYSSQLELYKFIT